MNMKTMTASFAILYGLTMSGCIEKEPSDTSSHEHHDHDGHDHDHDHHGHDHDHGDADRQPDTYAGIRGEITQLPDASVPGSELKIKHEQIRDFKTKDGTINVTADGIAGMRSMTMPFPLGEGINLDGFDLGDKVEFDFVVNWGNNRPAWEITKIGKLPADIELDYSNVIEDAIDELQDEANELIEDHSGHDHDGP